MVTEQASEQNLSQLSGAQSNVSTERLLNLLELSNSDLTASTGMEELPVTEMLLETLLGVLQSECPELLTHSQRVAFLCYGMGRQFGWSAKRINTLVTAALLHDLGKLASSSQRPLWDETASEEELSRYVTIDLLETCHADSDLLEILSQSLHFRYREEQPEQSDCPTPEHVLLGAAAFQFAHLFEKVRFQRGGTLHLSEIVAALQHVAELPIEEQVVGALEEWLAGRDKIIHSFDPSMFFPGKQDMDEETAAFVRATFVEILEELYNLQKNYDAFFILDSTGRFQLWNSGCQLHHGYSIREMRNKHWHNSLIGYCNQEGLAFSDAQTPLFQTLESGKPARTTLFLKKGEHNLVEADVDSIPIMGRDKLMLGIVELHRITGVEKLSPPDILYTPEWISELSGELGRLVQEEPEAHTIPDLDDELILIIESRLSIAPDFSTLSADVPAPELEYQQTEDSSSSIDLDEGEVNEDLHAAIELDPGDSDILTAEQVAKANVPEHADLELTESDTALGAVESDTVASEEPEHDVSLVESDTSLAPVDEEAVEVTEASVDFVMAEETSEDEELPELGSHLDNLLSRFDDMVTETDELEETEAVETTSADSESSTAAEVSGLEKPEAAEALPEVEQVEAEQSVEEEEPEEAAASVVDDDTAEHVLESSLELGAAQAAEHVAAEEPQEAVDEDDVLSFLMEDSSVDAEAAPEAVETAGDVAEEAASEPEESPAETSASAEEPEELEGLESIEVMDASNVLNSEDEADFELDYNVTDSELLQALQDEELAVEDEPEETAAPAESSTESTVGDQVTEDALEPEATPLVEEHTAEPTTVPVEGASEEPPGELAEEASEEAVAHEVEEIPEQPVTEAVEEVSEEPVVERAEEAAGEPVAEQTEEAAEEAVAEQTEEAVEEPVAEQTEESVEQPVAERVEEVTEESLVEPVERVSEPETAGEVSEERAEEQPDETTGAEVEPAAVEEPEPQPALQEEPEEAEDAETVLVGATPPKETQELFAQQTAPEQHAAPVSRSEWDAFVSYLLDPNSADHEQVAVLFLDLDRFKAINEGFGRQIGDDLLKEISRRLSESCGTRELACRYGGGQFAIGCPGLTLEKASKRGDQIRKLIERTRFDVLPFQALTVSVGVAGSEEGDTLNDLMNRAEHSLYNAKSSGRNCVVAMSSEQIEAELAQEEEEISSVATDKSFEVVAEFEAMIASDMIVYKLGGFLYDMHAKLLHVDKRHVSMRVGSKGFLPYWGRQDDARPVLIDLELGEGWGEQKDGQKPSKSSLIHIRIRPDGWVRNQETFYKRAQHVLRELKGYFAGS